MCIRDRSDRNDIVYINQLSELQRLLIKEERYEEADKIGKIIKDEEIKLGIRAVSYTHLGKHG